MNLQHIAPPFWLQAMDGCKFVIHTASPFKWSTWMINNDWTIGPRGIPPKKLLRLDAKDVQKELIEPAVKGTEAPLCVDWREKIGWWRCMSPVFLCFCFFFFRNLFLLTYRHISESRIDFFFGFILFHKLWMEMEITWKMPEVFLDAAFALATLQAVMRAAAKAMEREWCSCWFREEKGIRICIYVISRLSLEYARTCLYQRTTCQKTAAVFRLASIVL